VRIDRAAWPFVAIASVPAAVAGVWSWPLAALLLVLPVLIAWFFRDPEREAPEDPSLVLAPADGRVMYAGPADPAHAPPGTWQHVVIFLSPLDVHINRTPIGGRVTRVTYHPGAFRPAYHHDAAKNERSEVWVERDGLVVVFRQVVGLLVRRVVCRVKAGDVLRAGDRIGVMKFGSRMDVFLPMSATLQVAAGLHTRGAQTVIARLQV
jgi:phosphatidylserine decarboxylase